MSSTGFSISPLSVEAAQRLRFTGGEIYVADEYPGYPCRQCLRDAQVGEEVILVSYDPFANSSESPYRSASPIFVHRSDCGAWDSPSTLPEQLTSRELSVRAFDRYDMMSHGSVIDGTDLEGLISELFEDETVERLHVHNAGRGCYAARIDRADIGTDR